MKNTEQIQQEYAERLGYDTFNHLIETDLNALDFHVSKVQEIYADALLDKVAESCIIQDNNWHKSISQEDVLKFKIK